MCWMCVQNERRSYGYGGGVNRRSWNNKSTAAITRQNAAVNKFLEVTKRHESTCKGKEGLILLLTPAEHLTGACYTTFRKKVAEKCNKSQFLGSFRKFSKIFLGNF